MARCEAIVVYFTTDFYATTKFESSSPFYMVVKEMGPDLRHAAATIDLLEAYPAELDSNQQKHL